MKDLHRSKYSFLQSALYKCDKELVFSLADDNEPDFASLQHLIKIGVIQSIETPHCYQFTAPLVYDAVYRSFMSGSNVIQNPTSDADFQQFLLCVLANMNPHRLIGSCHFQGRKTGNVYEDFWQKEFYCSMAKQLSGSLSISTNVGREFKQKQLSTRVHVGFMDFYINHNVTLCKKGCYTVLYNACIHVLCRRYTRVIRMCITLRMDTLYTVAYNNYSITLCITSV